MPSARTKRVLSRVLLTASVIMVVFFSLASPVSASSDDGLQISINNNDFVVQVRIGLELDFPELYAREKLYIDFFHVVSLIKQNYERVRHMKREILIFVERKEDSNELVFSWSDGEGTREVIREVIRRDHMTLCNILKDELDLPFDSDIKEIAIGYTTYNDYEDIEEGVTGTEIYLGAIPGSYEVLLDGELVEVFAWFMKREAKKFYKDGRLYKEDRTVKITTDNFDKYLAGYLAFNDGEE